MDDQMKLLKEKYKNTPVPEELHEMVIRAVEQQEERTEVRVSDQKRGSGRGQGWIKRLSCCAAAAVVCLGVLTNISPEINQAMAAMPVVGSLVEVFTFREFKQEVGESGLDVEIPGVTGLESEALTAQLNQEFLEYGTAVAEAYRRDVGQMLENVDESELRYSVTSSYQVLAENERILVLAVTTIYEQGSSLEVSRFYTVDKQRSAVIAISDLFAEDSDYMEVISCEIKNQMGKEMELEENHIYYLDGQEGVGGQDGIKPFSLIDENQNFFIDDSGRLNIVFDAYEVAPGFMGSPQFVIPHELIQSILSVTGMELLK